MATYSYHQMHVIFYIINNHTHNENQVTNGKGIGLA